MGSIEAVCARYSLMLSMSEINADEFGQSGSVGGVENPETCGLAVSKVCQALKRGGPQGFVQGGIVETFL